jgi:hypothetical protein
VTWIEEYLLLEYGDARSKEIWVDIHRWYVEKISYHDFFLISMVVLPLPLHLQDCADSKKVEGLSSGLEMIRRH